MVGLGWFTNRIRILPKKKVEKVRLVQISTFLQISAHLSKVKGSVCFIIGATLKIEITEVCLKTVLTYGRTHSCFTE